MVMAVIVLAGSGVSWAQHLDRIRVAILPMETINVPKVPWNSKGFKIPLKGPTGRRINGKIRMFRAGGAGTPEGAAKSYLINQRAPESDNCIRYIGFHTFDAHITPENTLVVDANLDEDYLAGIRQKSDQRWVLVFEDKSGPDTNGIWIATSFVKRYFSSGIEVDIDATGAKANSPVAQGLIHFVSYGNPFTTAAGFLPGQSLDDPCLESNGDIQVKGERLLLIARSYSCVAGSSATSAVSGVGYPNSITVPTDLRER
jgi:hypothetical protein